MKNYSIPLHFLPHCKLCVCMMHGPDLPHQREDLLDLEEQQTPSISKTAP